MENQEYHLIKENAQVVYGTIGEIFSPALQDNVRFTAEGFNHIIFTGARSERERSAQVKRFELLPLAAKLLALSTTYQEFDDITKEEIVPGDSGEEIKKIHRIRYWGIIGIIDGYKIKVVVRKIGEDGAAHFWSVIPGWVTGKRRNGNVVTMKGNPDED